MLQLILCHMLRLHQSTSQLFLIILLASQGLTSAYDSSSMQFHPDGRVLQIEYSKDAVKKGGAIAAYRCKDGIVIVAFRKSPQSLFLAKPLQKVFKIDGNIVIAATGLLFDANIIIGVAKKICSQHRSIYCDEMPVENLCEEISQIMHKQTTDNTRPFGVGLIVAGIDKLLGPQLYVLDSEGSINAWNAICIGMRSEKVMKSLAASFSEISTNGDLSVVDAWPIFQSSLREHFPSKDTALDASLDSPKGDRGRRMDVKDTNDDSFIQTSFDEMPLSESVIKEVADDFLGRNSFKISDEYSDDYWELEATSMMMNLADEVCITEFRFPISHILSTSL